MKPYNPPCHTWTRGTRYGIWHFIPAYGIFMTATFKPTDPTLSAFTLTFATPADFERWAKHTL